MDLQNMLQSMGLVDAFTTAADIEPIDSGGGCVPNCTDGCSQGCYHSCAPQNT